MNVVIRPPGAEERPVQELAYGANGLAFALPGGRGQHASGCPALEAVWSNAGPGVALTQDTAEELRNEIASLPGGYAAAHEGNQ